MHSLSLSLLSSAESVRCAKCRRFWHVGCEASAMTEKPPRGMTWTCQADLLGLAPPKADSAKEPTPTEPDAAKDDTVDSPDDPPESAAAKANTQSQPLRTRGMRHKTWLESEREKDPTDRAAVDESKGFKCYRMWPYRYFGQQTAPYDALHPEDLIYPPGHQRIGDLYQASVPTWEEQLALGVGNRPPDPDERGQDTLEAPSSTHLTPLDPHTLPNSTPAAAVPNGGGVEGTYQRDMALASRASTPISAKPSAAPHPPFRSSDLRQSGVTPQGTPSSTVEDDERLGLDPLPPTSAMAPSHQFRPATPSLLGSPEKPSGTTNGEDMDNPEGDADSDSDEGDRDSDNDAEDSGPGTSTPTTEAMEANMPGALPDAKELPPDSTAAALSAPDILIESAPDAHADRARGSRSKRGRGRGRTTRGRGRGRGRSTYRGRGASATRATQRTLSLPEMATTAPDRSPWPNRGSDENVTLIWSPSLPMPEKIRTCITLPEMGCLLPCTEKKKELTS